MYFFYGDIKKDGGSNHVVNVVYAEKVRQVRSPSPYWFMVRLFPDLGHHLPVEQVHDAVGKTGITL